MKRAERGEKIIITIIIFFVLACAPLSPLCADPSVQCCQAARKIERKLFLPKGILQAIANIESGKPAQNGDRMPWPWAANVEGTGHYFKTKQEAIDAVKQWQSKGIQNIDVGCMQVNLKYHPKAFNCLEDAFDPEKNITYGAQYLKTLKKEAITWRKAIGHFHSKDEGKAQAYRSKVLTLWNKRSHNDKVFLANVYPASSLKKKSLFKSQLRGFSKSPSKRKFSSLSSFRGPRKRLKGMALRYLSQK